MSAMPMSKMDLFELQVKYGIDLTWPNIRVTRNVCFKKYAPDYMFVPTQV